MSHPAAIGAIVLTVATVSAGQFLAPVAPERMPARVYSIPLPPKISFADFALMGACDFDKRLANAKHLSPVQRLKVAIALDDCLKQWQLLLAKKV